MNNHINHRNRNNKDNMKHKIVGFDSNVLNVVTNGTFQDIIDGNHLFVGTGRVVNRDTDEVISHEITPMIMLINQGCNDKIESLRTFINGDDPRYIQEFDREINYFNKTTSAREIAVNYRNY